MGLQSQTPPSDLHFNFQLGALFEKQMELVQKNWRKMTSFKVVNLLLLKNYKRFLLTKVYKDHERVQFKD